MEVGMSLCRMGPAGLGRGGYYGIAFMADLVWGRILVWGRFLVWSGYVCCCGLTCVVVCVPELSVGSTVHEQRVDQRQQLPWALP